jgi:erythromycin esterase
MRTDHLSIRPVKSTSMRHWFVALLSAIASVAHAQPSRIESLGKGAVVERALDANTAHDFSVRLSRGMSAELIVQQIGIDVVVEIRAPNGRLLEVVDSPTGRTGQERVEIVADAGGAFAIRVRAYDAREPAGRYRLTVASWRDARSTARLLAVRARARDSATVWLRRRAAPLKLDTAAGLPPLDRIATRARVLGLGEATHGSREIADLRLAVTQYLIQRHSVRLVAIEHSANRLALLNRWLLGEPVDDRDVERTLESGWIGRRTLGQLVRWLRQWNAAHPAARVQVVGVDAHESASARELLLRVLPNWYGEPSASTFGAAIAEIAVADSQALVFGDSRVSAASHRTLLELTARLEADAPLLSARFGADTLRAARHAARLLMQFADFNAGAGNGRSRDWYMAANVVDALMAAPAGTRAVFWAHNAHIAVAPDRASGGFLREALGCGYQALATSFREGGVVAQLPNDLQNRLAISTLPPPPEESIDAVLGKVYGGDAVATWGCATDVRDAPSWLQAPQSLHWVGGLFAPGSLPSDAFRPFRLLNDFDGIFYLTRVSADEIYTDRPLVPSRRTP